MPLLHRTALWLLSGLIACCALQGVACSHRASTTTPVEAPKPKPRNAAEIAQAVVGAKVTTLVYMNRLRGHSVATKISALEEVRTTFEGTGLDPIRDVERAVLASTGIHRHDTSVAVAQHNLTEAQLKASLEALMAKSNPPGRWINVGVPAAQISVQGQRQVVALVEPGFVVILPESLASEAKRWVGTGGFPEPMGQEATHTLVLEPAQTLRAHHAPDIPPTLNAARLLTRLVPDGSADLTLEAQSTDEKQAAADAIALTESVERATSVKISIVRVRMFKPVPFRAEGNLVKSDLHLTPEEIDLLFRLRPR